MPKTEKVTLRRDCRKVIYQVFTSSLAEMRAGKLLVNMDDIFKRTAFLTGKSESSVRRIVKEGEQHGGIFVTPGKKRSGRPKKQLDDFDICALRQKIHFFYSVKKEVPTLKKIQVMVKKDLNFNCCIETLRKQIHAIGFRYKKCQSNRKSLMEKPDIAAKREFE